MSTDQQIEKEIQAKGLIAPRVTPAALEAEIAHEYYGSGLDFHDPGDGREQDRTTLRLLTFCVLVLHNGFTITGTSACASPENFDAEIGQKIARQNALEQLWPLLGFRLRDRLAAEAAAHEVLRSYESEER